MSDFELLDIAIGLMFVYLSFSVIVTAVVEIISSFLRLRAKHLRQGVALLLDGQADSMNAPLAAAVFEHPLVKRLTDAKADPSYLTSPLFATVLRDLLGSGRLAQLLPSSGGGGDRATTLSQMPLGDATGSGSASTVGDLVAKLPPSELKQALEALVKGAKDDATSTVAAIEVWYNEAMDRISGVFKRSLQKITLVVALLVAVGLNVDTIQIVQSLAGDQDIRARLVDRALATVEGQPALEQACAAPVGAGQAGDQAGVAGQQAEGPVPSSQEATHEAVVTSINCRTEVIARVLEDVSGLPVGWANAPQGADIALAVVGWTMTAAALWLGAPFWFDLLSRFVRLRGSGPSAEPADRNARL